MNIALLALVIDVMAIGLLAAVIVYAIRLNKYFTMLRSGKEELARQLTTFADSTRRAEEAMVKMKVSTEEHATLLDQQIRRAELIRKDLSRNQVSSDVRGESPPRRESGERGGGVGSRGSGSGAGTRVRRGSSASSSVTGGEEGVSARERVLSRRRRTEESSEGEEKAEGDAGSRQRSKSKTELLKALQGMR